MTNKEKFKEVFGYTPGDICVIPYKVCKEQDKSCMSCPFINWWRKEYKPCFQMLGEYDEDK